MLSTLRSRRFALFALVIIVVGAVGEAVLLVVNASGTAAATRPGAVFIPSGSRAVVILGSAQRLEDGGATDLSTLRGHVAVLNFWASWCPPCYREAPVLQSISEEQAANGVLFLGVDAQESTPTSGRLFVADRGVKYPNVFDGDGQLQLAVGKAIALPALPVTVVLDPQGRVGGVVYGEARYTDLTHLIQQVSAQP